MLRLKRLQAERKKKIAAEVPPPSDTRPTANHQSKSNLCLQRDIAELEPIAGVELHFPDANDLQHFLALVTPMEGMYSGATFSFTVEVPSSYPHDPPRVVCSTLVFNPSISWEGHLDLNVLRSDWTPLIGLRGVLMGLLWLFLEVHPYDCLNGEAAKLLEDNPVEFERTVRQTLHGGQVLGRHFPKLI
ncbi:CAAX prenyl protease [Balamuthia mandrillaris]